MDVSQQPSGHTEIIAVLEPVPVAVRRVRRALRSLRWKTAVMAEGRSAARVVTLTPRRFGSLLAQIVAGVGALLLHVTAGVTEPVYEGGVDPGGPLQTGDELCVHVKPVGSMSEITVTGPDTPARRRIIGRLRKRLRG